MACHQPHNVLAPQQHHALVAVFPAKPLDDAAQNAMPLLPRFPCHPSHAKLS